MASVDVLIPTYKRSSVLAVTLTSLCAQTFRDFRVVISDQTEDEEIAACLQVQTPLRVLRAHGCEVEIYKHLPRRGMAEQRQFLLDQARAPYALFLDDDLILEPDVIARMVKAMREEPCGFVGCAVIGLSFAGDVRPHEQEIEFWEGRVEPEEVRPGTPAWNRYRLHNAANLLHVQRKLGITSENQRKYKIAWTGGCVLYDAEKLRAAGGYEFWRALPPDHCGEDVLAQLRVMARDGGCGLIPSGVYHQELPTTIPERRVDAPQVLRDGAFHEPRVSVLMPTYNQANFISRAIDSLSAQSFTDWELVIVDDGSTDETRARIEPYMHNARIRYYRMNQNRGLGAALNQALSRARAPLIAYLPSDDIYHATHLEKLVASLDENPDAALAFSGVRHHYNRAAVGQIDGYSLQLVQVMHRRTSDRWLEREELVTDDLHRMFWHRLLDKGKFVGTDEVTCEWVDHPDQLHKIIQEPVGGINLYRTKFRVKHPLRFHTTVGNYIDEVERYRHFRERPATPLAKDGLKILLVGELAYNAERVLALAERGHKLYGLWMPDPYWYNTVGPLPFGHCEDLPAANWRKALREIKPDVIYALLNWQAVPFAREVLQEKGEIPFVWHFKEGPFICLEKGTWSQLIELYARADGQIYSSPEMRDWFDTVVPGLTNRAPSFVLDGDLPKRDWFVGARSERISQTDGEIHTVVPGRPIGLHPHTVSELAAQKIHLHFYGDFTHGQWRAWIEKARSMADGYLHLHANVNQEDWVREFSKYDAGWLHFFKSENAGDLRRANWDDLNYPARLATLAVAGLPMLQGDNTGSIVATQTLARRENLGLFFSTMEELGAQLRDENQMNELRESVWRQRDKFTFDYHADRLIQFFRQVIEKQGRKDEG